MKFIRDILLIDCEMTGVNPRKDFMLQLSAILLDKDNLLEKGHFDTYIKHSFAQTTNDQVIQTLGISKEQLFRSPNLREVITAFNQKFSYNVTIATHNIYNVLFLQEAFTKCGIPYEYDYHILELWTLGYAFLARQNIKKVPTAETLGIYFHVKKEREHNALINARFLAEIVRKLL